MLFLTDKHTRHIVGVALKQLQLAGVYNTRCNALFVFFQFQRNICKIIAVRIYSRFCF